MNQAHLVNRGGLQTLLDTLREQGYSVIGPRVSEGAVMTAPIETLEDLPVGWTERQAPGHYRLEKRPDKALFGFTVGPDSFKAYLVKPRLKLWSANLKGDQPTIEETPPADQKLALFGIRSCDMAGLRIQDQVFMREGAVDPHYQATRGSLFLIAVQCTDPAPTCFCASMGKGPQCSDGFDLALTEILDDSRHDFLVEVGSEEGRRIMTQIPHHDASREELNLVRTLWRRANASISRTMEVTNLKDDVYLASDHTEWDSVAQRCLSCANCTMVCPTCFCTSFEDTTDLTGDHAERWRRWDSCFSLDHSYIHGGHVRRSTKSKYRQWMTHKLATWQDQFGVIGCTGCGRCITWCPVGIDITEEIRLIRQQETSVKVKGELSP